MALRRHGIGGAKEKIDRSAFGFVERVQEIKPELRDRRDSLPIIIGAARRETAHRCRRA